MQTINVYPRISDLVSQWFGQIFDFDNTVLPLSVLPEASGDNEADAISLGMTEVEDSVTLQIDEEPVVTLQGVVNEANSAMVLSSGIPSPRGFP